MLKKFKKVKTDKCDLIQLNPVIDILRAAIWTGKSADERPVSIMLIAEQESAKTEALKFFRNTSTLFYLSDLTSRGLTHYRSDIEKGTLKHIVLLDLVRVLSHGKGTSERTIQSLASLIEEGESDVADGGGLSKWSNFPRIGALMGITPSFFNSKRGKWRQTGFLTRFIPLCFKYKAKTVAEIHMAIAKGMQTPKPHPETIPEEPYTVHCSKDNSYYLSTRATELGKQMKSYGFRYHRVLRALAKANARLAGRNQVNQSDIFKVLEWSEYFTDKEKEL